MKPVNIVLLLSSLLVLSACYGPSSSTGKTRGQEINECMAKGTPEECDRQVNSRRSSY
jgi:hypothetical protein